MPPTTLVAKKSMGKKSCKAMNKQKMPEKTKKTHQNSQCRRKKSMKKHPNFKQTSSKNSLPKSYRIF